MPSRTRITRRELVVAGAGAAAAVSVPPAWARRLVKVDPKIGRGTFLDGVASGEPATDAVTLWTRMTTEQQRSGARLIVARDEGLDDVVRTTVVPTSAAVDGALKARVSGLEPGTVYYYGFESADGTSDIGRTRTVPPADSATPLKVGFSSCQNWPEGYFTGHADAAAQDLDFYCFLGDYTYEYGPRAGKVAGRDDPAPSVDLRSYRDKLRLYRSDAGLRELHRLHPVAHVWDDHEVADNYSDNAPRPADLQRAAGYQASFEWLPRLADPRDRYRIHRSLRIGQAEIFLLDQRQYRTGDGDGRPRSLLGREQLDWFKGALAASTARWKLVANQVMFVPLGIGGVGVNPDQWDGYGAERREVLDVIAGGVDNVMFFTGDIHTYFTARVLRDEIIGPPVATEYVCGSITSRGLPALAGLSTAGIFAANPWITYANGDDHGWGLAEITPEEARVSYRVSPIDVREAAARELAVYRQPAGANDYETVSQPLPARRLRGPAAPRTLHSSAAPTRALASRRRRHEKLEQEARERAERRLRRAARRRKARRT